MAPEDPDIPAHALALERFKLSADSDKSQRERELEDIKFIDFDDQWPTVYKDARAGQPQANGMPATPARPAITINKLRQPAEQVSNQGRQARLSVQFAPKSDDASKEVAEAYEDIARERQAESHAKSARQWAFDRAIKVGRGWYRILTDYANDGDCDLDIIYKRILNQASVYADPSSQEPDWSDGEWLLHTQDLPWERYVREHPDSDLAAKDDGELTAIGDSQPDWIKHGAPGTASKTGRVIRIAEYWRVVHTQEQVGLYQLTDGTEKTFAESEVPEGAIPVQSPDGIQQTRMKDVRSVEVAKLNAIEFLKEKGQTSAFQAWPGRFIPFIPVVGQESNADGERRWTGIVRPAMDACRLFNYQATSLAETTNLATKSPWVGYIETIEPYLAWWAQSNTRAFPILPIVAARAPDGSVLPPPQRNVAEPAILAIMQTMQAADGFIKATTGIFDPSLGNIDPAERSGKAILALQKQAEFGTAMFVDNLATMSMGLEGKILRDLIPKVYFRPGRIVAVVDGEDRRSTVMVGKPFILKNGKPVEVPPGTEGAKFIDLSQGEYSVAVTVGKSNTTRREEGAAAMGEIISSVPQIFPIIGDLYLEKLDIPGAQQMADRFKKSLPPNLQDEQDGPNIAQLQQQMQQMQEMLQMMTQELQAKTKIIETDQVKQQGQLQIKQVQEQGESERSATEAQLKATELQSKHAIEMRKLEVQLEIEMAKLGNAQMMKRGEIEAEQLHQHGEALMQQEELGADQAQADMDRQSGRNEAEADRQLQREEGSQSRAFEADQAERTRQTERELASQQDDGA